MPGFVRIFRGSHKPHPREGIRDDALTVASSSALVGPARRERKRLGIARNYYLEELQDLEENDLALIRKRLEKLKRDEGR